MARLSVGRQPREYESGVPSGAMLGSLSLHTALLAFMFWGATQIDIPPPPLTYQVELVAAPRSAPVRTVPAPDAAPAAAETEVEARPVETRPEPAVKTRKETRPAEVDKEEAETQPQLSVDEQPAAPPEQSPEGVEGTPVRLEGAPFPYPEYLANIILQIKRHWRPPTGGQQLRAELAFAILRDGSIDDVVWVRRSGVPGFDLEARGAIETAGRRRVFGPLPEDYPSEQLRVSFFFDPTRY